MTQLELVLILLVTLGVVAVAAQRWRMPYPIAFTAGGVLLALVPGLPAFALPPELILTLFLPILLMEAAYFTSLRDFKRNFIPVMQLAVGLVIVTTIGVAFVAHWIIPGMGLAAAFVLSAIISPPDAVAATSVFKNVRAPKRIVDILEGESLINDATGLILYRFAVLAVVTGHYSFEEMSVEFLWMVLSGIVIGVGIGYAFMKAFHLIREPSVEILSTFLVPYAAFLMTEAVHGSAVLAVVACGVTVGWMAPMVFKPAFTVPAESAWKIVTFVFNGFVFLLIGYQFLELLENISEHNYLQLALYAIAITLAAIAIRFIWVYAMAYGTRFFFPSFREKDPYPPWQNVFIVAWTGIRGVVTLATALAIPMTIESGAAFPHRDLIIFLAFSVILITMAVQGISLPWLLKKLKVMYEFNFLHEQWMARREGAQAAMERLMAVTPGDHGQIGHERVMAHYRDQLNALGDGPNTPLQRNEAPTPVNHPHVKAEHEIWQVVLEAERQAVVGLRRGFKISDDVMHEILRDIDLRHNLYK
jgi:Na+/H+ antiporter